MAAADQPSDFPVKDLIGGRVRKAEAITRLHAGFDFRNSHS
jgi:hypothetical protein